MSDQVTEQPIKPTSTTIIKALLRKVRGVISCRIC